MLSVETIPSLENGDRLTLVEFERRYQAMSDVKKAELIAGVVYMASPLKFRSHAKPHAHIMTWLGYYCALTPGVELADNATVRMGVNNECQPDALLRIEQGGQSKMTSDDYLQGAPELIVEIAASSVSYDLHDKFIVYQEHQVQEYLVWRVNDVAFDWFRLTQGRYIKVSPNLDGIISSLLFPGLWLDVAALLGGNVAKVLDVLQQGISTAEHQAFIAL